MPRVLVELRKHNFEGRFEDLTDEPAPTVLATEDLIYKLAPGAVSRSDSDKPPYAVPSMVEINALEPNGFKVCSLFAGCGGSSLGYRMAGFKIAFASEFVEAARDSYAANASPGTVIDDRDIRTVEPAEILAVTGLAEGELDVLDGSPPCASFSTAGKRQKGWRKVRSYSDTVQRSDDLFFEYIRILTGLRPKVFIAENVSGLVKGVSKGYFLEILRRMKSLDYRVEARTLDAQWLGVPQRRKRVIFMGIRNDLGCDPVFPQPLPYRYVLKDALPWIRKAVYNSKGQFPVEDFTNGPAVTITASNRDHLFVEAETDISRYAIGREWDRIGPGGMGHSDQAFFSLVRPRPDEPVPTITAMVGTASAASVVHPTEKRKFSVAELKRLCAFPDDFELTGNFGQQCERLGRAVPPVMMSHLAATIRDHILRPASYAVAAA